MATRDDTGAALGGDPFGIFGTWLREAEAGEPNDPTAMTLATATADGRPSARMVLFNDFDRHCFVFYTNMGSRKSEEIKENAQAALLFHWKSLRRQVRVEGAVSQVTEAQSDAYFGSRPRHSKQGACAYDPSRPMGFSAGDKLLLVKLTSQFMHRVVVGLVCYRNGLLCLWRVC